MKIYKQFDGNGYTKSNNKIRREYFSGHYEAFILYIELMSNDDGFVVSKTELQERTGLTAERQWKKAKKIIQLTGMLKEGKLNIPGEGWHHTWSINENKIIPLQEFKELVEEYINSQKSKNKKQNNKI